jgi:hypothetical protein
MVGFYWPMPSAHPSDNASPSDDDQWEILRLPSPRHELVHESLGLPWLRLEVLSKDSVAETSAVKYPATTCVTRGILGREFVSLKYHLWMCGTERGVDSVGRERAWEG